MTSPHAAGDRGPAGIVGFSSGLHPFCAAACKTSSRSWASPHEPAMDNGFYIFRPKSSSHSFSMNSELKRLLVAPLRTDFWRRHSVPDLLREARVVAIAGFHPWQVARSAYHFAEYEGAERWYRELARLLRMLAHPPPRFVLEIGVGQGGSMFAWAQVSARDAHLIGVDDFGTRTRSSVGRLYTATEVQERILGTGVVSASRRLTLIPGNSHSDHVKRSVLNTLQGQKLDFLFVDGDHSYEGVWQDFRDYAPLVREGGLIAFHDIVPDFKARCGIDTGTWAGGVYKFWAEISQQYRGISIIDKDKQDTCGIGVIRYSRCSK